MQDLKTSTLIRDGLAYLWDGADFREVRREEKEEYLCHAIVRAARGGSSEWMCRYERAEPIVEARLEVVRGVIEKRLYPWNSLAAWLQYQAGVPEADLTNLNLQKHRKQWAQRMIAEFDAKGD